jgi:hypothetical protein
MSASHSADFYAKLLTSKETNPGDPSLQTYDEDGWQPREVPCKIHLNEGGWVHVTDVNAWGHLDDGVFAIGTDHTGDLVNVWIPNSAIKCISFDFEALERFKKERG